MTKVGVKRTLIALMCALAVALAGIAVFAGGGTFSSTTAKAEQQYTVDLTSPIRASCGNAVADAASNIMYFKFDGGLSMRDGSRMETNEVTPADGDTPATTMGDYFEITCREGVDTINGWKKRGKSFRISCYGPYFLVQYENNSMSNGNEVTAVRFMQGFTLFEGSEAANGDWAFGHKCELKVAGSTFDKDLSLHLNRTTGYYEHLVSDDANSLQVVGTAQKNEYYEGEEFVPAGLTLTVKSADGDTYTDIAVTEAMCSAIGSGGVVTISYGGKTAQYTTTVLETENAPVAISATNVTLTAKRYSLLSNVTIPEGAKLTVTYADDSTQEVAITKAMLSANTDTDLSAAGDTTCTLTYQEAGVTNTCSVKITVSSETVQSGITGINYGQAATFSGGYAVDFTGDTSGRKAIDNVHTRPSTVSGKTLGDLVEIKIDGQEKATLTELMTTYTNWVPAFYGGRFVIRNNEALHIQYMILRAGFIGYSSNADNFGTYKAGDEQNYFAVASSVLTQDMYIGYAGGKQVEPVTDLTVTVAETAKTTYYVGDALDLTGITYTATFLENYKAQETGNVTAAMCSAVPTEAGSANITVSYNGASATFAITVEEAAATFDSLEMKSGYSITYDKFGYTPTVGGKVIAHYSDGTSEEIDLTAAMITVRCDTTTSGNKKVTVSYTKYATTQTVEANATVSTDTVDSKLTGMTYGIGTVNGNGHFYLQPSYVTGGADGLKALGNIGVLESLVPGKTLGDLVEIKFSKKAELVKLSDAGLAQVQPRFYGGQFVITDLNKVEEEYGTVEYIVVRAGFIWYTNATDTFNNGNTASTEGYTVVPTNVVTKDLYAGIVNGNWQQPITGFTVNLPQGYKTEYLLGEALSTAGVTLTVNYIDPSLEDGSIALTAAMCGAVTGDETAAEAVITYMGKTQTITGLQVLNEVVGGIEIATAGKTQYSFAVEEFDLDSYVINVIVKDGAGNVLRKSPIDNAGVTVSGYNSHDLGTQTVTLSYAGFDATVDVTTVNDAPEKRLSVDYLATYSSYESTKLHGLVVHTSLEGMPAVSFKTFYQAHMVPNVADKVKINGILASELIADGRLNSIRFWTDQIVFMFDSKQLQPNKGELYEEGVTELVKTVTFLPGFQLYFTQEDFWPGDHPWTPEEIIPINHGVIKEEITLENVGAGMGWMRELKKNTDGTVASDAISIGSLPTRTQFTVGEKVTAATLLPGLQLHFKYNDGGEEDVPVGLSDIELESNVTATAGKKTVYVYFKTDDYYASFEIDVVAESDKKGDEGGKKGCKSAVGAPTALAIGTVLLGAAAVVTLRRKKERN